MNIDDDKNFIFTRKNLNRSIVFRNESNYRSNQTNY
jgi:hypothetical protein